MEEVSPLLELIFGQSLRTDFQICEQILKKC